MPIELDADKTYLTKDEIKHLTEFKDRGFVEGNTYTNSKGESRLYARHFYPVGWQDEETVFYEKNVSPKGRPPVYKNVFSTPSGSNELTKTVMINYAVKDGKKLVHHRTDSVEWLGWIGDSFVAEEPSPPAPNPLEKLSPEQLQKRGGIDLNSVGADKQWKRPGSRK